MDAPLQDVLERLHARFAGMCDGEVATYIPELARASPDHFAICCATADGHVYAVGNAEEPFTIQSISKPFVYGLALDDLGLEAVGSKVGVEPSGEAFNAISLEPATGRPRNPMINAGAIATASLVRGADSDDQLSRTVDMLTAFAGRPLVVDDAVYRSERDTGHRNRAIAYLLRNAGIVGEDVDTVLDRYFQQCSVTVTARDLALMAATLANGGVNPVSSDRAIGYDNVQQVLSVMSTCGMYDYAGSWLYRVGMPAKSGVSGGVIAVLPGQLGIGVYSPRLDVFGNSVRGVAVCEALSKEFGLHLLRPPVQPGAVITHAHTLADVGSKRRRGIEEMRVLASGGAEIHVLRLHGPLAFSTAEVALRQAATAYRPGRTILFDCSRVSAADSAASRMFQHFANMAFSTSGTVIIAGLREPEVWQAASAGEGGNGPLFFEDADAALEWCEDRLIGGTASPAGSGDDMPPGAHPMLASLTPVEFNIVERRLVRRRFEPGELVIRQGERADAIYLVVGGMASVQLNLPGERRHRVATLGPGTTFGELALLDDQPRTADVQADSPLSCRVLRIDDFIALEEEAPGVRLKLMQQVARDLASRLRRADQEIMTLAS